MVLFCWVINMKVEIVATTSERLSEAMQRKNMKQADLARLTEIDKSSISLYLSGKYSPKGDKLYKLSLALGVSPAWLSGFNAPMIDNPNIEDNLTSPTVTDDVITFPVVGDIAAGFDQLAVEDWSGETVDVPLSYLRGRDKSEFFVLNVKGDSMYPLYHEGDKVLILKQSTLNRSGDIGAVIYEGECATLKKVEYVMGEDWMRLIPLNPNYKPVEITGVDLERCRVLGIPFVLIREFY